MPNVVLRSLSKLTMFRLVPIMTMLMYSSYHGLEEQKDCLGYRNSVRGLSNTFVRVTEYIRISLVDENVNIVKFWSAKFKEAGFPSFNFTQRPKITLPQILIIL